MMGQLFQAVQLWNRNKRRAIAGGSHEAKKIHFKIDKTCISMQGGKPEE